MRPIEPQTVQHHPASAVGLTPNQPEQRTLRCDFWKQHQEFKQEIGAERSKSNGTRKLLADAYSTRSTLPLGRGCLG
jgi:hypothetical protein